MVFHPLDLIQPFLRLLDPEQAHELSLWGLEKGFYPRQWRKDDVRLEQTLWGLRFSNPIGMAAGYDKDARVPDPLLAIGFGFVEVGTVTPKPQTGNEKPRLFRLASEGAVINRMGFNNEGHGQMLARLNARSLNASSGLEKAKKGIVGVNIGANKTSENPVEDYVQGLQVFNSIADYFTINISSPNTPGLRTLQSPEKLHGLLSLLMTTRGVMMEAGQPWRPILVKLAPDLADEDLTEIIECLKQSDIDGIIISNTTVSRDGLPDTAIAGEAGGLSGHPLFQASTHMLAKVYLMTEGTIPLIGVGGIDSPERALNKILAGASLIQLYTGLIYQGLGLLGRIKRRIVNEMEQNNLSELSQLVGKDAEIWAHRELSQRD